MKTGSVHWGSLSTYRSQIYGFACLWVMCFHNFCDWPTILTPLKKAVSYGNTGVDMFLFLSGISLYFAFRKSSSLRTFYSRRMVRLLIPFLLLAVPYWIWRDIYLQKGVFLLDVTMASFVTQGTTTTWYVGAILVFYLTYPLVYRLYFGSVHADQPKLRSVIAILLPASYVLVCFSLMYLFPTFYKRTEIALTRFVVFLIGCSCGQLVEKKTEYTHTHTHS